VLAAPLQPPAQLVEILVLHHLSLVVQYQLNLLVEVVVVDMFLLVVQVGIYIPMGKMVVVAAAVVTTARTIIMV
jgi:hypothetical protein